jgi:hypothetical protein
MGSAPNVFAGSADTRQHGGGSLAGGWRRWGHLCKQERERGVVESPMLALK